MCAGSPDARTIRPVLSAGETHTAHRQRETPAGCSCPGRAGSRQSPQHREPVRPPLRDITAEPSADGVVARPDLLRHRLVDERDWRPRRLFRLRDVAAADERDVERRRNPRRRPNERDQGSSPRGTVCPSTMTLPPPPPAPSGTKFEANADCTPGRPSTRRTMSWTRRSLAPFDLVARARQVETQRHQRRGVESDVGVLQVEEAANEKRRTDEKHERHGNFNHDEPVAEPRAAATGRAARAFFQAVLQVAARRSATRARGQRRCPCRARSRSCRRWSARLAPSG